ncbi:MAG: hypothetical protein KF726_21930 [Anaerolineae bacterium]|nr:hypothetical protein [Anaerolineae bacterium]
MTIQKVSLVADIGIIPWVHPSIRWGQVKIEVSATYSSTPPTPTPTPTPYTVTLTLDGYIPLTNTSATPIAPKPSNCQALDYPAPDQAVTKVPPGNFTVTDQAPLFGVGSNIALAVMGTCRFHNGQSNPCSPDSNQSSPFYTTLDVIPVNVEFCIDSKGYTIDPITGQYQLTQCSPTGAPTRVPIYAPVDGCLTYTIGGTSPSQLAQIEFDFNPPNASGYQTSWSCSTVTGNSPRWQLSIVHVINVPGGAQVRQPVSKGALIGYVCTATDWKDTLRPCGFSISANAEPHLAVSLRNKVGTVDVSRADALGFLSIPYCLYDRWIGKISSGSVTPTPQPNRDLEACPQ